MCEASTLGDELKKKQEYLATALEIKTEVPESLYGERLETLTLAMPQLGSAIRSSQTVYMGYRLAKPQVTKVETLRRDKLRLTFNQPINENANKPQLYEVRSKDIWNWRVQVKSVTISEDARTAELEIEPLYKGDYTVALNRVSSKMSAANVSSSRDTATFKVVVWPRDRAFYFARFPGAAADCGGAAAGAAGQLVGRAPPDRAAEQEPRPSICWPVRGTERLAPPLGHAVLEPALLDCREPLGRHGGKQLDYRQRRRAV